MSPENLLFPIITFDFSKGCLFFLKNTGTLQLHACTSKFVAGFLTSFS